MALSALCKKVSMTSSRCCSTEPSGQSAARKRVHKSTLSMVPLTIFIFSPLVICFLLPRLNHKQRSVTMFERHNATS